MPEFKCYFSVAWRELDIKEKNQAHFYNFNYLQMTVQQKTHSQALPSTVQTPHRHKHTHIIN